MNNVFASIKDADLTSYPGGMSRSVLATRSVSGAVNMTNNDALNHIARADRYR